MENVLVTGASGFIGRALVSAFDSNITVRITLRKKNIPQLIDVNDTVFVADINKNTNWLNALGGIEVVVHLAARVHIMDDSVSEPLSEYRKVNFDATLNLAKQAAESGVKRFIYLSSIKVNGEFTKVNQPYTEKSKPAPVDPYAISKLEAEYALQTLSEKTGMEIVCIRPPLVYGPGVKANFLNMMKWLNKGIPLPFGAIHNKRSLVALDNLVDLIITCIEHPNAANQVFLAGDGVDLSTTELLKKVSYALGRKPRLIPVPQKLLEFILVILGKRNLSQRLCGSLQVDISKARELLGWVPPVSIEEELDKTAQEFLRSQS